MNIAIRSTADQKNELIEKGFSKEVSVQWVDAASTFSTINADVFFDFTFNDKNISANELIDDKIVFVHAVNCTCEEINKSNYIRLNAWNGFLNRDVIELVCNNAETQNKVEQLFNALEWKYAWLKDDYGLIAARIIAMIINEAYFALEENVSTKQQIDIAMKLGTNYPFGPFEWSEKIGLHNVLSLLQQLGKQNSRYTISALLVQESQQF